MRALVLRKIIFSDAACACVLIEKAPPDACCESYRTGSARTRNPGGNRAAPDWDSPPANLQDAPVRSERQTETKLHLSHGGRGRNLSKRTRDHGSLARTGIIQAHHIECVGGLHARLESKELPHLEVSRDGQIHIP